MLHDRGLIKKKILERVQWFIEVQKNHVLYESKIFKPEIELPDLPHH